VKNNKFNNLIFEYYIKNISKESEFMIFVYKILAISELRSILLSYIVDILKKLELKSLITTIF
jgi:hypothetical protein